MLTISRCFFLLPLLLSVSLLAGEKKIQWKLESDSVSASRGQIVQVKLHGTLPEGYYTYGAHEYPEGVAAGPTQFKLTPENLATISGEIVSPDFKMKLDPLKEIDIKVYEKKIDFVIPLQIAKDAAPGEHELAFEIRYQVCNETQCIPGKGTVSLKLSVADVPSIASPLIGGDLTGKKEEKIEVAWKLDSTSLKGARGETLTLKVHGKIPAGYHAYAAKPYPKDVPAMPTVFAFAPDTLVKVNGSIEGTPPHKFYEEISKTNIDVFEKDVTFTIPLRISPDAKPGVHEVALKIDYQICNDQSCIMFDDDRAPKFAIKLEVSDAPVVTASAPIAAGDDSAAINEARSKGIWYYFWFSMAAGATALLTPCVFPMIPITVSFFTKRKQASRAIAIRDAGIYAIGIIATFTAIGLVVSAVFGATGLNKFAANPWVNLAFAALFVVLAMSLFGVFEIQLPVGLLNKLNTASGKGDSVVSVLLMGAVFSLTSFTCTVPFIGATLFSAAQGDWMWPLIGMIGFSTAFALPFFLLALFPAALKSMPKSGGWLNSVKVVMGFLEIAAAMKFLSNADLVWRLGILTREMFLSIWVALTVLVTFYLLGRFQFEHDTPVERVGGFRVLTASAFLSVGIWLATGLTGAKLGELDAFVPPRIYPGHGATTGGGDKNTKHDELTWGDNYEKALAEAKRTNTPLFVDFTGYTCTNCRLMEENIFPHPDVNAELKKFIRVRLYTDGGDAQSDKNQEFEQQRYNTVALPLYAIIDPYGKDIAPPFQGLTRDPQTFVKFLKQGTSKLAAK